MSRNKCCAHFAGVEPSSIHQGSCQGTAAIEHPAFFPAPGGCRDALLAMAEVQLAAPRALCRHPPHSTQRLRQQQAGNCLPISSTKELGDKLALDASQIEQLQANVQPTTHPALSCFMTYMLLSSVLSSSMFCLRKRIASSGLFITDCLESRRAVLTLAFVCRSIIPCVVIDVLVLV